MMQESLDNTNPKLGSDLSYSWFVYTFYTTQRLLVGLDHKLVGKKLLGEFQVPFMVLKEEVGGGNDQGGRGGGRERDTFSRIL